MNIFESIKEYCRDREAKCPHCGTKVSLKQRSVYFWRGTSHYINCDHCGGAMHPAKEAIPVAYSFSGGMFIAYVFPTFYIYYIEDSFWHAVLFTLPFAFLFLLAVCILTYRRLEFTI